MPETKLKIQSFGEKINAPRGFIINGRIVVSVASNNITVAIKNLAGNDASPSDPVIIRIGDTVRSITTALSVTKNAGTNWCNAGGAELAAKEVDYFVYLGYNTTDGVTIGFSRVPYGTVYSSFSATTTNEKYCAISTIANAASGDSYENIGRFAATLSGGAGYTWSVPTYTSANLIQKPVLESRWLSWSPVYTGFSVNPTDVYSVYKIVDDMLFAHIHSQTGGTSNATTLTLTFPMSPIDTGYANWIGSALTVDGGAQQSTPSMIYMGSTITASIYKTWHASSTWTASGGKNVTTGDIVYKI